jgi:hypothetical protein
MTVFERAAMRNTQSALSYQVIPATWDGGGSWDDNDLYVTDQIFKGIHANADGAVSIVGIDDNACTFFVKAGCTYPYGGKAINPIGTTLSIDSSPPGLILLS